ncbi:MAG: hypothetical protein KC462_03290 [Cyanobacteria bacterium HKST-UBA05]|nr:hypothetical protein [Cyanobacteria bacterium HKST-UBA05]
MSQWLWSWINCFHGVLNIFDGGCWLQAPDAVYLDRRRQHSRNRYLGRRLSDFEGPEAMIEFDVSCAVALHRQHRDDRQQQPC